MTYEIVKNIHNGTEIIMPISDDGFALCPVCGSKAGNKEHRPYDETGQPSYDICTCGIEYGYECDSESTATDWERYRTRWVNETLDYGNSKTMPKSKKRIQLKAIGIHI